MGTVYEIQMEEVTLESGSTEGVCSLYASWTTKESPGSGSGSFTVLISSMGQTVLSQNTQEKEITLEDISFDAQKDYSLIVTVTGQEDVFAESVIMCESYRNLTGHYDGRKLTLSWDMPRRSIAFGECILKGDNSGIYSYRIPPYRNGYEIEINESFLGGDVTFQVSMTPYASDISSGISSELDEVFCPKYVASHSGNEETEWIYRGLGRKSGQEVIPLTGEIYQTDEQGNSKAPEEPIRQGPLMLGNVPPYTLSVETEKTLVREDYNAFVAAAGALVTAKAMYRILEAVARCARQRSSDMLYFYCGLCPQKRSVDLRPGLTLRLEQEMYMPNLQMNAKDAAGFVGVHTAEYPIFLGRESQMEYLVFDSMIAQFDEEIYPPEQNQEVKPAGAGILDLSAVRMRQPYYRLQYPQAFYSSEAEPDIYAGNNVLLFAAPVWEEVPLPLGKTSVSAVPYLLFRGRSALTLLITVTVNGKERKLPVGTTLGNLFQTAGRLRFYRRNAFGEEIPVVLEEQWEEMPLLQGDRIEV